MATAKEEKIIKLRRGIASPQTPDYIRERMQAELDELLKPEPPPAPEPVVVAKPKPVVVAKPKPVAKKPAKAKPAPKKEVKIETPPPPPVPTGPSAEEKERLKAEYAVRRAKRKEKNNQ